MIKFIEALLLKPLYRRFKIELEGSIFFIFGVTHMNADALQISIPVLTIIGIVFSGVSGIIVYFLKQTMDRLGQCEKENKTIRQEYARKDELEKLERNSGDKFTTLEKRMNERFDKVDAQVTGIVQNYITKEDFVVRMAELGRQNERIYDQLLAMTKDRGNK